MRSGFGLLPAVHGPIQARGGLHHTDVVQGKVIQTVTIIYGVFTKLAPQSNQSLSQTLVRLVLRTLSLSPTAEVENGQTMRTFTLVWLEKVKAGFNGPTSATNNRLNVSFINIFPPTPTVTFQGGSAAEEDVSVLNPSVSGRVFLEDVCPADPGGDLVELWLFPAHTV